MHIAAVLCAPTIRTGVCAAAVRDAANSFPIAPPSFPLQSAALSAAGAGREKDVGGRNSAGFDTFHWSYSPDDDPMLIPCMQSGARAIRVTIPAVRVI